MHAGARVPHAWRLPTPDEVSMKAVRATVFTLTAIALATPAMAQDAAAAKALLKKNECTKCHVEDKEKKGPSYKKIAAKYKGKADAEAALIKQMTTSPKVKLDDGTEEEHKAIKADEAAVRNIAKWILAM
jgi:cytochrome c